MKDLKRTVVVIIITIQVLPCLITGQSVGAPTMATPSVAPGGAEGGIGSDKTTTGVYNTTSHVTNSRETNTTLEQTRLLDFMTLPIENGSSTLEGTLFPLTNITLQPDLSSTANTKITSDSVENVSPSEQLTDGVIGDSSVTRTSVSQSIRNVHDANLTTVATTGAYVTDHVTNSRETNTTLLQTKRPNVMTLSNENGSSTFESFDFLSRNNLTEPILNSTAKPENSSKNVVMTTPNENVDSTFEYLDFLSLNRSTDPTLNSTANPQFTSENTSVYQMTGNPTDELLRNSSVTGLGEDSHSVIRLHDIHITTVATTGVRNVTNNSDTNTTPDTGLVDVMTLPNENTTLESLSFPFINTTSEPTLNSTANPQNQSKNVSVYQTTEGFITNSSVTTIVDEYHSVSSLHDINNTADATNGAQDKANTTFQSPSFSFKNTSTEPSLDTTANPKYTSVPSENTTSASDKMTVSSTYLQISNSTVTETVLNTVDLYDNNYTTEETATTMPSVTYRSQTDGIVTTLPFTGNPDVGAGQPTAAEDGISTVRSDISSVSIYNHTDLGITHNRSNLENNVTSQNAITTVAHSGGTYQTTTTMRTLEAMSSTVHGNTTGDADEDSTAAITSYSVDTHPPTPAHTQAHPSQNFTPSNTTQPFKSHTTPMFNIVASPSIFYIGDWDKPSNHTAPATVPNTTNPPTTTAPSVAASQTQPIERTSRHSSLTTLIRAVTSYNSSTLSTLPNTRSRTSSEHLQRTSSKEEHTDSTMPSIPHSGTQTTTENLLRTSSTEERMGVTTTSSTLSVSLKDTIHSTSTPGEALVTPSVSTPSTSTTVMSSSLVRETTHQQSTSSYTLPVLTTSHISSSQQTPFTLTPSLTLPPSTTLPSSTPIQPDQTMAPDTTLAASTMATTMKITTAAPTTQSTTTVPTTTTTTTRMKTTTAKVTTVKPTTAKVTTVKAATVKATTARPRVTSNTTVLTTTTTPAPPYLVQAPPRTANLVPDQIPSEIIVSISTIIVFDKPWHRDLARAWSREYKTFTGAFSATMLTYFESVRNSGFDRLLVDKLSSMTVQVEESSNRRKRQVEEYTAVSYIVQYAYKRLMASGGVDRVLRRTGIPAAVKDRSLNVDGFTPVGSTELIFTSQAEVDKEALKKLVQFDNPCQYYECDRGFSCHQDEVDNTKFSCISRCMVNFCLTKGFCTHLLEGHPTCKCDSTSGGWYTGERCEYFISHVAAVCAAVGVQAVLLACVVFKRRKDSPYLLPVRIAPANSYTRSVHALGKR
ncbi:mucin-5AC-like isoform X1 [Branchiostoma floridae]|uniref:Mucin-5AC-like isoform X1 n=1 Tax=Branchiostoma floridae TaxID=7739 RepID=A0A9J7HP90_BRAFL|nr:mucin-5AC-like isoform X1 [Branchiostoma floridae]